MNHFDGIEVGIHNIAMLSDAKSRSITAENFKGEKSMGGRASKGTGENASRELGVGWKVSPSVIIQAGERFEMVNIKESGCIKHIWMTTSVEQWRNLILRMYWDDEQSPSVIVPLGDFFCNGWCEHSLVNSTSIVVNPAGGFNSYFPMPFKKAARIEIDNISNQDIVLYYQVDYILTEVSSDMAYFHAQWRRSNPVQKGDIHTVLDGVHGKGHYVGTYMAIQVNNNGWWGEGEVKFYLDGDKEYPTICGTGTEDYFGGAWNFEQPKGTYCLYSTAYSGLNQIIRPDGLYQANTRFGMYRFHIADPIRFNENLKVTIQDLGWRANGKYLCRQDDIATTAYWYQSEPHNPFESLLNKDDLEII
jgi:hypothetical protein